jgi:hypothetical protein
MTEIVRVVATSPRGNGGLIAAELSMAIQHGSLRHTMSTGVFILFVFK